MLFAFDQLSHEKKAIFYPIQKFLLSRCRVLSYYQWKARDLR
jgi:hypothetical protein